MLEIGKIINKKSESLSSNKKDQNGGFIQNVRN
jgi:hypothetical protein